MAEIDIEDGDIHLRQFLDISGILVGAHRFQIQQDDIGFLDGCGFNVDQTAFVSLECRHLGKVGEFIQILAICRRVGFDQIAAPGGDRANRVFQIERSNQIKLPAFAQKHALDRNLDLNLTPGNIGHGDRGLFRGGILGVSWRQDKRRRQKKTSCGKEAAQTIHDVSPTGCCDRTESQMPAAIQKDAA